MRKNEAEKFYRCLRQLAIRMPAPLSANNLIHSILLELYLRGPTPWRQIHREFHTAHVFLRFRLERVIRPSRGNKGVDVVEISPKGERAIRGHVDNLRFLAHRLDYAVTGAERKAIVAAANAMAKLATWDGSSKKRGRQKPLKSSYARY
jgi:hypothetical protein